MFSVGSREAIRESRDNVTVLVPVAGSTIALESGILPHFCSRVTIIREPASGLVPPASEITSVKRFGPNKLWMPGDATDPITETGRLKSSVRLAVICGVEIYLTSRLASGC